MDELKAISAVWPIFVALLGTVGGYAVLQYKTKADSKRIDGLEAGLAQLRNDMVTSISTITTQADKDIERYMEMERQEHTVIIGRFEGEINKLGSRMDLGLDRLSQKIDKLVDYNLAQKDK